MSQKIPKDLKWEATGKNLGEGGQAKVIEVEDKSDTDAPRRAMKILSNDKSRKAYERFYREIEAIKGLDHPYVIKTYDHSALDAEFHYYVMEFVEGAKSLKRVLADQTSNPYYGDPLASINLFKQMVGVIEACRKIGLVHRDLSPANVLILPDETIKVIDFGLCQFDDAGSITSIDEGIGTQNYMSPECESGQEGEVSFRSDLYSAGKIMWTAITNQMAFSREKPVFTTKAMNRIFSDQPETWHLHHIFGKTIRHDPSNRWSTTDEAVRICNRVSSVIREGYPSIFQMQRTCPICGFGHLRHHREIAPRGLVVHPFRNEAKFEDTTLQCDYCSVWLAIDPEKILGKISEIESFE